MEKKKQFHIPRSACKTADFAHRWRYLIQKFQRRDLDSLSPYTEVPAYPPSTLPAYPPRHYPDILPRHYPHIPPQHCPRIPPRHYPDIPPWLYPCIPPRHASHQRPGFKKDTMPLFWLVKIIGTFPKHFGSNGKYIRYHQYLAPTSTLYIPTQSCNAA